MTNGDKIRGMTNDELAKFMVIHGCRYCLNEKCTDCGVYRNIKKWLESEAEQ